MVVHMYGRVGVGVEKVTFTSSSRELVGNCADQVLVLHLIKSSA